MHLLTIPTQLILPDVSQHSVPFLALLMASQSHTPRKSITGQLHPPHDTNTSYLQAKHVLELIDKSGTS